MTRQSRPWLPRRRGIRVDQPYRESNEYSENLSYDHEYYTPRLPGIPNPPRKQPTLEESITGIKKEIDDQKQTRILQSLERKVDKLDKWERDKSEFEKKLAINQNKKTESGNLKKISTTNQDNKIGSISHFKEPQKTKKSIEQKKFTNHESTQKDKNMPIYDHNNDKSAAIGTDMIPLVLACAFEGFCTGIASGIDNKQNKIKNNNIPLQKVKLIPSQKAKIIHPIKGHLREAKKEGEMKLTPLDK